VSDFPLTSSIERALRQPLNGARVPVYRSLLANGILYRCPLQYRFSPTERGEILDRLLGFFPSISLNPEGWLELFLSDDALADRLEELESSIAIDFPESPRGEFCFLFHYTHARCTGLLRLAEREGFLDPSYRPLVHHPLERALILQLLTAVDRQGKKDPRALAIDLCGAILDLDRRCRLVGEPLEIARSRVRLLSIARGVLRAFLASELGIIPLDEC
jgi:hypothetical protein